MSTSKKKLSFINLTESKSKESYSLTEWAPLRIIGHRTLKNQKRQYKVIWRPSKVNEEYSISPKYRLWLDNIKEYDAPDATTIKQLENIPKKYKKYKNESMKPEFVDGIKRFICYEKNQTCKAKARERQRQKYTFTVVWNTTWENAYILNETEVLQKYLDHLRDRREDGDQIPKDEYLTDSNDETTSQSSVELVPNQVHAEEDPDQALVSDDDSPVHTQDNPDQDPRSNNINQVHAEEDPDQALVSDDDSPVHTQETKTSPVPATPCNSPRPSSSNFGMSLFISTRRTFTTIDSNPSTPQRQPQCRSSPRFHALTPRSIDSYPSTPHPQCRSSPRLQINTSLKKRKQKMCKKGKKN